MAMLSAYFDTSPFDNLLKVNRLAASDLAELRSAVQAQKLAVVSNMLNIQETIDALHSMSPEVVIWSAPHIPANYKFRLLGRSCIVPFKRPELARCQRPKARMRTQVAT